VDSISVVLLHHLPRDGVSTPPTWRRCQCQGCTPLYRYRIIEYIGSLSTLQNRSCCTTCLEMASLLLQHGADVNAKGTGEGSLCTGKIRLSHRYLKSRLIELTSRLPVTSFIVDSAAIYIMVVKFRNTIWPPPPQLSHHRTAALSSNSNGTRSVYSRENPKSSLYCEMSMG
jgi:hypothetical protein